MRLVFVPGFGEEPEIFGRIAPLLPGEKLFIHNLDLLGTKPAPGITAIQYAQRLVDHHNLTRNDVLIGHSMGGWIAYAIKHLIDCPVVQIASWTDPKKVAIRLNKPDYLHWVIKKGWYFNPSTKRLLGWLGYRGQPSAPIFDQVFQHLIDSHPEYIMNQLRVIMNPLNTAISVEPDVRIHAQKDTIIRFPDQPASTVPGDHFTLMTFPETVVSPILDFLGKPNRLGGLSE